MAQSPPIGKLRATHFAIYGSRYLPPYIRKPKMAQVDVQFEQHQAAISRASERRIRHLRTRIIRLGLNELNPVEIVYQAL